MNKEIVSISVNQNRYTFSRKKGNFTIREIFLDQEESNVSPRLPNRTKRNRK